LLKDYVRVSNEQVTDSELVATTVDTPPSLADSDVDISDIDQVKRVSPSWTPKFDVEVVIIRDHPIGTDPKKGEDEQNVNLTTPDGILQTSDPSAGSKTAACYPSTQDSGHEIDTNGVSEHMPNIKREAMTILPTSANFQGDSKSLQTTAKLKTKNPTKSPYFTPLNEKKKRVAGGTISCIPFPPLSASHFGLLQEKVASEPFWLLVGVALLNRTHGKKSIPAFFALRHRYPTIEDMAEADKQEIIDMTHHLGFSNQRADKFIALAQRWLIDPPTKGVRRRKLHYPLKNDGKDIKPNEVLDDEDERVAWELADYPSAGAYALDSWRIFCRDKLRGVAQGYDGEGGEEEFEPEWMRVLPTDKELRAFLRWKWLKCGWEWDPFTGKVVPATKELLDAAERGDVVWDDKGGIEIRRADTLVMDEGSSAVALKKLEDEGLIDEDTAEAKNVQEVDQ
jgi:methyl-CpG-binding domain protein 4